MPDAFAAAVRATPPSELRAARPQSLANMAWALATWGRCDTMALDCLAEAMLHQVGGWGDASGRGLCGGHHHVWMDCVREGCGAHAIIPSTLPGRPDGSSGPVHDSLGVCAARARACRLLRAGARCGARQACTALPHGLHTSGDTIAIRPCHTSLTAHSLPALYLLASQLSVSNNDSGICVYQ